MHGYDFFTRLVVYLTQLSKTCLLLFLKKKCMFQSYPMTKFGQQNCSFNASYYSFDWLEYSILNDALYCFACRNYGSGSNNEETFTKIDFKKWNKVKLK